mgnify:CR=1 FL=1
MTNYEYCSESEAKALETALIELGEENIELKKAIATANWILSGMLVWSGMWPNADPETLIRCCDELSFKDSGVSREKWKPQRMSKKWIETIK